LFAPTPLSFVSFRLGVLFGRRSRMREDYR
jgi:hypothetical protein